MLSVPLPPRGVLLAAGTTGVDLAIAHFLSNRLIQSLLCIFGVSVIVFALSWLTGDPVSLILPPDTPPEAADRFRQELGLDRPIYLQYLDFAWSALQGDFGRSLVQGDEAMRLVAERLPASLKLAAYTLLFSLLLGVPTGILAAVKRGTLYDQASRALAFIGQAVPNFYLGIILIMFVSVRWRWLPSMGNPNDVQGMILPAITLGVYLAAETMRMLRSSLLEVLGLQFVTTARGKGVAERGVIWKHALRNAGIPVITVLGLQISTLLGRSIVVEVVFAYPGMGQLAVNAVQSRDIFVVQAYVLVVSMIVLTSNLLVDVTYGLLDPRIRYG